MCFILYFPDFTKENPNCTILKKIIILIDDYANYQLEKLDFMEARFEVSQLLQRWVTGWPFFI